VIRDQKKADRQEDRPKGEKEASKTQYFSLHSDRCWSGNYFFNIKKRKKEDRAKKAERQSGNWR